MGGYQFIHIEMYSRTGRDGRGTSWVFDEAARHPDSCHHVSRPLPPQTVFGVDVDTVRIEHDRRTAEAKTKTKTGKTRAVRKDQNTLVTVVVSHPAALGEMRLGTRQAVEDWEKRTVAWLQQEFGGSLVSVVRHLDEAHPHLHGFVIPQDTEMRAARLHPGAKAKLDAMAFSLPNEDRTNANKRGDTAYRQAMRDWQDSYWQAVGLPCGLSRLGPRRRRLSRAEWKAEQTAQAAVAIAAQNAAIITDDAKKRVEAAKAKVVAAEQKVMETAAHAEMLVNIARADADNIIGKANIEAERAKDHWRRFSGLGAWMRALFDGLRRSQIQNALKIQIEASAAERIAAMAAMRDRALDQERAERIHRRKTETVMSRLQSRLEQVAFERDRLRAALARHRTIEKSPTAAPKLKLR